MTPKVRLQRQCQPFGTASRPPLCSWSTSDFANLPCPRALRPVGGAQGWNRGLPVLGLKATIPITVANVAGEPQRPAPTVQMSLRQGFSQQRQSAHNAQHTENDGNREAENTLWLARESRSLHRNSKASSERGPSKSHERRLKQRYDFVGMKNRQNSATLGLVAA